MGHKLFRTVTEATGLPQDAISNELTSLLKAAGFEPENMTIDDLRCVLAEYVQDILLAAKEELLRKEAVVQAIHEIELELDAAK